jgi:hypothetical protein
LAYVTDIEVQPPLLIPPCFFFEQEPNMANDLDDTIRQNAQGPAKVAGDAGSVEQHPLPDQIEADRFLRARQGAERKNRGLRFTKLIPPGQTGSDRSGQGQV